MKLVVISGVSQGREFKIDQGTNLIGRWDSDSGSFPELDLEEEDPEAKISRKHALITREGESAYLEDLGSRNGTFVNRGERLAEGQRHELVDGDEIMIGKSVFKFISA